MFGYALACYVGLGFYFVSGDNGWRGPLGLTMVLPAINLSGLYWMPESPRYLLAKDRVEEAWAIVKRLHSPEHGGDHEFAKREFYQMRKQIEIDTKLATSYWGIFTTPSLFRRAWTTMLLEFCLMSSGVLVILSMFISHYQE